MILTILKTNYPYHFKNIEGDAQIAMQMVWEMQFKDEPYNTVLNAVQKWIGEKTYMPTVADIKNLITDKTPKIEQMDYWHKRFGYGSEPIYYDDDFSESVIWDEVPKDIRSRMKYHCNPKDYAEYNAVVEQVLDVNPMAKVKFYDEKDTEFLKGKMVTWKNEVQVI